MKDSEPAEVSVIVPCRNAAATIGDLIDSCAAQGAARIEVILVDSSCTDDTIARGRARCQAHGISCAVAASDEDGSGPARNVGFARSTGAFIVFADADDRFVRGKVTAQTAALREQATGPAMVSSDYIWCDERPEEQVRLPMPQATSADPAFDLLRGSFWAPPVAWMLNREAALRLAAHGGFSRALRFQDREYFTKAILLGVQHFHLPRLLAEYRLWSKQQMSLSLPRHHYAPFVRQIHDSVGRLANESGVVALSAASARLIQANLEVLVPAQLRRKRGADGRLGIVLPDESLLWLDALEAAAVLGVERLGEPFFGPMAANYITTIFPHLDAQFLGLLDAIDRLAAHGVFEPLGPTNAGRGDGTPDARASSPR